ncbi:MAG: sugar ABC transporter permease [Spirochaetales bacterium]|nr:sugar ABC transporter permease [Spirochaetales bacterium]
MNTKSLEKTPWPTVLSFLLPGFIGFILFVFFPMLSTFLISFTNYSGGPNWKIVGIDNYLTIAKDKHFLQSLVVTVKFVLIGVSLQIIMGLLFAMLLNRNILGQTFFRSLFFMPNVLSSVGISLAFSLIFHPTKGVANQILEYFGLPDSPWLTDPSTALLSIIMVVLWMSFGYYMIIFLGGLQSINSSLYEAADIDGANGVQKFFRVTLPMLSPTMFFALTMCIINSFKVFDQIFMMTGGTDGGGPAGSTNVVVYDIYQNSFRNFRFGYASAESLILLIIILVITVIQFNNQKKWVTYDI